MSERHVPSKLAIGAIIGGVALYEALCPKGELISEEVDRLRETKVGRYVVPIVIGTTALHLLRLLPPAIDPLHRLGERKS